MTHIELFTFSPYATNCYVCHSDGEAVLVDASCSEPEEVTQITDYVSANGLQMKHLLLTHAHIDHILGCAAMARCFNLPWTAHRDSRLLISTAQAQALMFGTTLEQPPKTQTMDPRGRCNPIWPGKVVSDGNPRARPWLRMLPRRKQQRHNGRRCLV